MYDTGSIAVVNYVSVISMLGDGPLKMHQTNKKTIPTFRAVPNNGFTIEKNPPKLIHLTLGNSY
jgi:hypothetical protein